MRIIFITFCTIVLFISSFGGELNSQISKSDAGFSYISNQVVVIINEGFSGDAIEEFTNNNYIAKIEPFYEGRLRKPLLKSLADRMFILTLDHGIDAAKFVNSLSDVEFIQSTGLRTIPRLFYTPDDPLLDQQWHLDKVQAYTAWEYIRSEMTENSVVAVNDAGINYNHLDIAANIWFNEHEEVNGLDDDENGYIDDYMGWDFADDDNDPMGNLDHGTGVAASISEVTDNGTMGAGLGFSARLMNLKSISDYGQLVDGYTCMFYAADNGAHVINCSWGIPIYQEYEQIIVDAVWDAGVLIVAAGGEGDQLTYPAAYNHVMAVSATDQNDHKAFFAPFGEYIDICAPGVTMGLAWGDSFSILSGTSFASGMVSGLAALIKAYYPEFTNEQILQLISDSADPIDHLNPGYEGLLGAGRINAANCFMTGIDEELEVPEHTSILSNYPNPFNSQTRIHFQLNQPSEVEITIYNILGRRIENMILGRKQVGNHFVVWDAHNLPSGVYFYKIQTDGYTDLHKCILLK